MKTMAWVSILKKELTDKEEINLHPKEKLNYIKTKIMTFGQFLIKTKILQGDALNH